MSAIVRHKKTNVLYEYLGEDKYKNLITEVEGFVHPETAKAIFSINVAATAVISQNDAIKRLISLLGLKIELGNDFVP